MHVLAPARHLRAGGAYAGVRHDEGRGLHGADDMRVEIWPGPSRDPGEALLKVEVASICGTT